MSDVHPCDYAFPVAPGDVPYWQPGMSMRDWFAGQALAGIAANSFTPWSPDAADIQDADIARAAFDLADAMLAARAKGGDT